MPSIQINPNGTLMSIKNIRIKAAASFKKKLKTLELALHHAGIHPRLCLYFVRDGGQTYTLQGKPINVAELMTTMDVLKGQEAVKVGNLLIPAFGKTKAVYAFIHPGQLPRTAQLESSSEYYHELLDHAHDHAMAPGFQYTRFFIDPGKQVFEAPKQKTVTEWTASPWRIWRYTLSDESLYLQVYRPTPPGMTDGVVEVVEYSMLSTTKVTWPVGVPVARGPREFAPATVRFHVTADTFGQFRHAALYPTYTFINSLNGKHWTLSGFAFSFDLRLPEKKA